MQDITADQTIRGHPESSTAEPTTQKSPQTSPVAPMPGSQSQTSLVDHPEAPIEDHAGVENNLQGQCHGDAVEGRSQSQWQEDDAPKSSPPQRQLQIGVYMPDPTPKYNPGNTKLTPTELGKLRKIRDISYTIAHPPAQAWFVRNISRSWFSEQYPGHFRQRGRMLSPDSELEKYGRKRLNMSETTWKALTEDTATRPSIPSSIEDRQIVRCDERHSLHDHSPEGTASIPCANCPDKIFDNPDPDSPHPDPSSPHMMCLVCISEQLTALSDDRKFTHMLKGYAWEPLCTRCIEKHKRLPKCTCEWEVPRCLEHRREHLEKLLKNYAPPVPDIVCSQCQAQTVTKSIPDVWHCDVCKGVFSLPDKTLPDWFQHQGLLRTYRGRLQAQMTEYAGSSDLGDFFDFSYSGEPN